MRVTNNESLHIGLSQLVKGDKAVATVPDKGKREVERSGEAARVTISSEARHLRKVIDLAKQGDEMRAEKVSKLKEQILQGQYHVEAIEVAKEIVRSEISQLLSHR
jgi:flagellar biosynthesis anti-sigma factor FlgM